jgi:hypothetical protein
VPRFEKLACKLLYTTFPQLLEVIERPLAASLVIMLATVYIVPYI